MSTFRFGHKKLPLGVGRIALFTAVGMAAATGFTGCRKAKPEAEATAETSAAPASTTALPASTPEPAAPAATTAAGPKAAKPNITLRIHGSSTIGTKLIPELAQAYLMKKGATNVQRIAGSSAAEVLVQGDFAGEAAPRTIEISSHDSASAFKDLKAGACDIGMSARRIKQTEAQDLFAKDGDLTSSASEHVVCLEGVAVIVNKANRLRSLTTDQVAGIFSGEITNWEKVGGLSGPIHLYARDENSGTADFFKLAVLTPRGKTLSPQTARIADGSKLAAAVDGDSIGIGFVSSPEIGSNIPLALSDRGLPARPPNVQNVRSEQYALSRRLYLYNAKDAKNVEASHFIEFAMGAAARPAVDHAGFIARAEAKAEAISKIQPTAAMPVAAKVSGLREAAAAPSEQQGVLNQRTSAIMAAKPH